LNREWICRSLKRKGSKNMKRIMMVLACVASALISVESGNAQVRSRANAKLAQLCPTIRELGPQQYKNNSPIRSGSLSSPITRFALNPTIIFIVGNPAVLSRANMYDSRGNYLTSGVRLSCAKRGRGECNSRYKGSERGANNVRQVRRRAVKSTGSATVFWKVSPTVCYRIPDVGKCYNVKVRGLCDGRTVG
jgi:hypothetical protein